MSVDIKPTMNQEKVQEQTKVKIICQRCSNVVNLDRSILFFDYSLYKQSIKTCRTHEEALDKSNTKYIDFLKSVGKLKGDNTKYPIPPSSSSSSSSSPSSPLQTASSRKTTVTTQPPKRLVQKHSVIQKHYPTIFPQMKKFAPTQNRERSHSLSTPPTTSEAAAATTPQQQQPLSPLLQSSSSSSSPSTSERKRSLSNGSRRPLPPLNKNKNTVYQKPHGVLLNAAQLLKKYDEGSLTNTDDKPSTKNNTSSLTSSSSSSLTSSENKDKEKIQQRSKRLKSHRNVKIMMKNGSFVVAQPGSEQQVLSDAVTSILSAVGVGKGKSESEYNSNANSNSSNISSSNSVSPDPRDPHSNIFSVMSAASCGDININNCNGGNSETYQNSQFLTSFSLPHNADDCKVDELLMEIESDTASCHPLCVSCAHKEYVFFDREINSYKEKISLYKTHLSEIEKDIPESAIDTAIEACLAEEKSLLVRIDAVKKRKLLLRPKQAALTKGKKRLSEMEAKYWTMYGEHQYSLSRTHELVHSLMTQIPMAKAHMAVLSRTYVLEDAFQVRPAGHFGSINGFRLGRFSNILVSWPEINCACGYAALLLRSVARTLKLDAVTNAIVPLGSTPKILSGVRGLAPLDLFYEGKMFAAKRFDEALAALLVLIKKATSHCLAADPKFAATVPLPYKIDNDMIGGTSIRFQVAKSDHIWTYALKNLLTDLKWLVLWLSAHTI